MTLIIDANKITFPDGSQQTTRGVQIRQRLKNSNNAQVTSNAVMSLTAPAVSDGVQILAQTITPTVVGSTIRASLRARGSINAAGWAVLGVFAGSTLLGALSNYYGGVGWGGSWSDDFEFTTTSLAPITIQVRLGSSVSSSTVALNQIGAGGSTLTLEELA